MQSSNDPVLDARLQLMESEATYAMSRRNVESVDLLAMGTITAAGIVIAPVVALLAAASTSDFAIPSPWDRVFPIAATLMFAAALAVLWFALHVRSEVDELAEKVGKARERVLRAERGIELEQLARELAMSGETATFWAALRKRFRY